MWCLLNVWGGLEQHAIWDTPIVSVIKSMGDLWTRYVTNVLLFLINFFFCIFPGMKMSSLEETQSNVNPLSYAFTSLHSQVSRFCICCMPWVAVVPFFFALIAKGFKNQLYLLHCTKSSWFCLRCRLTCFPRTEGTGGTTHHQNSNLFLPHTQRCSMVRATTRPRSVAPGRAHTTKMVRYNNTQHIKIYSERVKLKKDKFHDWQCVELWSWCTSAVFYF